MAGKRSYNDMCRFAHALDLVGERWALLIVRELILGPKRFTDLRAGLPHASPNVLSQRLRELEEAGVIRRRKLPPPAGSRVYELTEWGQELEPVVRQLGRWGAKAPTQPAPGSHIGRDSIVIALGSIFDPATAEGTEATYELRLGEDAFRIEIDDGQIRIERGRAEDPRATIATDDQTWGAVFGRQLGPDEAVRTGAVDIDGGAKELERFLSFFPMPGLATVPTGV